MLHTPIENVKARVVMSRCIRREECRGRDRYDELAALPHRFFFKKKLLLLSLLLLVSRLMFSAPCPVVADWQSRGAADPYSVDKAVTALRQRRVIAVPTDTIYGLAADATSSAAVDRIFDIKRRNRSKAVAICVSDSKLGAD